MIRWSSLITRVAILFLIVIAIWISRDAVVRTALIRTAEFAIGSKVDIGHVRTSLSDGKIYLKQLAIADPRYPMKNLVQADSVLLQINPDALMKRRFVVENGTATQVVFGAPRSKSGALRHTPLIVAPVEPTRVKVACSQHDPRADWLDRFQYARPAVNENKLQLVSMATKVFGRWDSDLKRHQTRIEGLKTEIREIHDLISFEANPLRNRDELQSAQQRLEALSRQMEAMATDIAELDQKLVRDRNSLTQAKEVDEKNIVDESTQCRVDGETITRILLHKNQIEQAEEILEWFAMFRESVPDPKSDFKPIAVSGNNISIPGVQTGPQFLIKSIQLDGKARLAGESFNFAGTARNFSNRPDLLDDPMTFEIRAQGNTHAVVKCVLDRSTQFRNDSITIHCPNFELPARNLGDEKSLLVSVSPCRTLVEISLVCREDELTGQLNFDYSNLVLQIEHLDQLAGGRKVAERINLELASISNYRVSASLTGPVNKPCVHFKSDLGERFAGKFNEIIESASKTARAELEQLLNNQIIRLDRDIAERAERIAFEFENDVLRRKAAVVADLRSRFSTNPVDRF